MCPSEDLGRKIGDGCLSAYVNHAFKYFLLPQPQVWECPKVCFQGLCFLYPASSSAVTNEGVVFISCDTSLGLPLNNLALFKAMGVEMV